MTQPIPGPILVPILGDQLTRTLSSLRGCAKDDTVILLMEVWDEATYVKHHKQKIVLIFSAMRHFAEALRDEGFAVRYVRLDDPDNSGSIEGEVARAVATCASWCRLRWTARHRRSVSGSTRRST
jgi:deoxyribodipyrimidine photolyase-related protein